MDVDLGRLKKTVGKWFVDFEGFKKCVGKLKKYSCRNSRKRRKKVIKLRKLAIPVSEVFD